jgi:hypothetical protein
MQIKFSVNFNAMCVLLPRAVSMKLAGHTLRTSTLCSIDPSVCAEGFSQLTL